MPIPDDIKKPAIILVSPQMSQNIGAVARAMLNFGATDLRLVAPQADWRSKDAYVLAAGASKVLDAARNYTTLEDALSDFTYTVALTARHRDINKDVLLPHEMVIHTTHQQEVGLVFGREKSGLENQHVGLCDCIVTLPTSKTFPSLNLAQSVAIIMYQWVLSKDLTFNTHALYKMPLATKETLYNFFHFLEDALDASGFLRVSHKRPLMIQNIRALFTRCAMTEQEVQTMHGIIRFLSKKS